MLRLGRRARREIDRSVAGHHQVDRRLVIRPLLRPPRSAVEVVAASGERVDEQTVAVVELQVQVRPSGVSRASHHAQELARQHPFAQPLARQRPRLEVAVPRHRSIGMANVNRVPRVVVELTAAIELAVLLHHDDARRDGNDDRFIVVHLAPREREGRDIGALMVVAVRLVVGARPTGVVLQLVRVGRVVIDVIGDGASVLLGMAGDEKKRPLHLGDETGFGRDCGQAADAAQALHVGVERRLDARTLCRCDLVARERHCTPANRSSQRQRCGVRGRVQRRCEHGEERHERNPRPGARRASRFSARRESHCHAPQAVRRF